MKIRQLKPFSYKKMYLINQFEKDILDTCMAKLKDNDDSKKTPVNFTSTATETDRISDDSKKEDSKPNNAPSNSDRDQSVIEVDENIDKPNVISDSSSPKSKQDDDFHGWKPEDIKTNQNNKKLSQYCMEPRKYHTHTKQE